MAVFPLGQHAHTPLLKDDLLVAFRAFLRATVFPAKIIMTRLCQALLPASCKRLFVLTVVPPLSKTPLQVNFFGEESLEEKAAVFQPLRDLGPVLVGFAAIFKDPARM